MLIDRAVVEVRSGKGGDGAISFLQEKNMPKGGPDGGNGGRGGSVYIKADKSINTLLAYRHSKVIAAEDGGKGDKKLRFGESKPDVYALVPCGTVVIDEASGRIEADLSEDGATYLAAKGGRGGKGNACFKSSRLRVPRFAENGHPGERRRLVLELKLLADVGLIGFPSVGKSTLLNLLSHANAVTADYPFTTLVPNLGVATTPDRSEQFVVADMPGLIEGASQGKGLGFAFLRHIERCRVLVHLVSMSGERDPYEDYLKIRKELTEYGAGLEDRPEIVVASKMDEEGAAERKAEFDAKLGHPCIGLSAYTEEGVKELLYKCAELLRNTPVFPQKVELSEEKVYDATKLQPPFVIKRPSANLFVIEGEQVMGQYALMNLSTDQGVARLLSYLDKLGVEQALQEKGAKDGDTVRIGEFEFVYAS